MDKRKVNSFRKILESERTRLTAETDRLQPGGVTRDNLGYGNHMADDATEVFEQAKDMALHQHLENLLTEVNDALERVDRQEYGVCEACTGPIDMERLQILPYARLCVDCQKKSEDSAPMH